MAQQSNEQQIRQAEMQVQERLEKYKADLASATALQVAQMGHAAAKEADMRQQETERIKVGMPSDVVGRLDVFNTTLSELQGRIMQAVDERLRAQRPMGKRVVRDEMGRITAVVPMEMNA
jgi:hypothetical protein